MGLYSPAMGSLLWATTLKKIHTPSSRAHQIPMGYGWGVELNLWISSHSAISQLSFSVFVNSNISSTWLHHQVWVSAGRCLHMVALRLLFSQSQVIFTGDICGSHCTSCGLVMAYPVSDSFYSSSCRDWGLLYNEWKLKFSQVAGNHLEVVSN